MISKRLGFVVLWLAMIVVSAGTMSAAQQPAAPPGQPALPPVTVCGRSVAPLAQPPAGSAPVVLFLAPCFEKQGGTSLVDAQTYIYYIQVKTSQPSQGIWIPYDETTEKTMHDDFQRLLSPPMDFLDNLSIEVSDQTGPLKDYVFPNGTIGKIIVYNMEERQRIKIGPDYEGSKKLEISKIDEALKANMAEIRLDSFIDPAKVRKVEGIVRDMMKEKGFTDAEVTHEIKEVPGGPKLVHLTFNINEGPNVKIKKIDFVGNNAISDSTLKASDEVHQADVVSVLHQRPWHVSGDQIRRRRREARGVLSGPRLHQGEHRRARSESGQRIERQEDALDRAARFRSPRGRAIKSGRSTSQATPS